MAAAAVQARSHSEGAQQDQKLPDKAVQSRQSDGGESHQQQEGGKNRQLLPQTAKIFDHTGMAAVVNHAHQQEERTGGEAMVEHL